jgi:hypothetical protein
MSTDTLEFPELDAAAPAASTAIAEQQATELSLETMDLTKLALSGFAESRAAVATAMKTLDGVQHDLSTPTKLAEAKTLRQRLVNAPLATARKVSAGIKSKLTEASKAVGAELVKIESDFAAADALITPQIDAAQEKLDEERRQREAAEVARVQAHCDNLAKLAGYAEHARGLPSGRIADGIEKVSAIVIDPEVWQDFTKHAEEQKAVTLERMRALHAEAVAAEEAARRAAEERAEQERKAAELKAEADRLAAERAEIERERAAIQAEKDRIAAEAQARADETARLEREQREEADRQARELQDAREHSERAEAQQTVIYTPSAEQTTLIERGREIVNDIIAAEVLGDAIARTATAPMPAPAPEVVPLRAAPAANEAPTLSLGEINQRIAPLTINAAGLASLGFQATKVKASCMYREQDWPDIHAKLAKKLNESAPQRRAA